MKSAWPSLISLFFLSACLYFTSFVSADPPSGTNKAEYFHREEKTIYDKVMSKHVSSFLIVGFVIIFFLMIVVFVGGVEGKIRTAANIFLGFYVFLLINYALWLFIQNNFILISGLVVTGGFFLFIPVAFLKEKLDEKMVRRKDLKLRWTCGQCGSVNQHSFKCWNCGRDKQ